MITVTCVRHGETVDNVGQLWAGWKDSQLTQHGMNQARAVGAYFGDETTGIRIHAMYASPLSRAFLTAQQIQSQQPLEHRPPLTPTDLLKEQFWGDAEGHPFTWGPPPSKDDETDAAGKYAPLTSRTSSFPNGESSDDVARRVDLFISEFIIPHVLASQADEETTLNIFVVSHGIAIAELIGAFLRRDPSVAKQAPETWRGLMNTAWTRMEITTRIETSHPPPITPSTRVKSSDPPLSVRITAVNQYSHLANVKRQRGGIGSSAYDPKQSSIKTSLVGIREAPLLKQGSSEIQPWGYGQLIFPVYCLLLFSWPY
ncbi:phosphoglycerate mutase-like protein [Clavulina sp. PMI_390]|nr:phosphoglycerate mutase-like protein [Clavulina sp. PMI_390]